MTRGGAPSQVVLALNNASSSLKFGLYRVGSERADSLVLGEAEALGGPQARIHAEDAQGAVLLREDAAGWQAADALGRIARLLGAGAWPAPQCIGHRIVHGGPVLRAHCRIDAAVLAALRAAVAFAPAHMPDALAVIDLARAHFPGLPQVACFDTSFHVTLPEVARVLPIPAELRDAGLQRYGFHGLSCESIVRQLGAELPCRLTIAHLGHGASVTAVRDGLSVDTSMGLTPTGGLIMSTRSGDLDPGILVYLLRQGRLDADALETLVDRRSGLLGISAVSGDLPDLHRAAAADAQARLAIEMFCYGAAKQIAATSAAGAPCAVRVLPSQEDEQIARHAWALA